MAQHRLPVVLSALGAVVLLAGCAAGPGTSPGTTGGSGGGSGGGFDLTAGIAAPGEVQGQGTVLQAPDEEPKLCLGPIMESYPPQCAGVPVTGWDWDEVDGEDTGSDVTYGAYAVTGTWDGETFGVTTAMTLALYDPMPIEDPLLDEANAGDTDPAELERIQAELHEAESPNILGSGIINGYLFVDVIYDDGSLQAFVDETYLPDAVAIRPALRDVG